LKFIPVARFGQLKTVDRTEIDQQLKTDPRLVSWDALNEDWKKHISSMVENWPAILANAHFKMEYLKPFLQREKSDG